MSTPAPRGFYVVWLSIAAGAAAVIALGLAHRPGGAVVPVIAGPRPPAPYVSVTPSRPPTAARVLPVRQARGSSVHPGVPSLPPSPSRSGALPSPSPSPSGPSKPPLLAASAAVVVPLRGTPTVLRVPRVVPGAPPLVAIDVALPLR